VVASPNSRRFERPCPLSTVTPSRQKSFINKAEFFTAAPGRRQGKRPRPRTTEPGGDRHSRPLGSAVNHGLAARSFDPATPRARRDAGR